jgi:mannan endo-1,6-alpha-mannosidase
MVGDLPEPYYWWEAGAMWGAMLDYYHYTGDSSYNDVILQALLHPANTGEHFDYMPVNHRSEEGNDDLGFWGFAVMSAAERNFPQPNPAVPSWLGLGENIFNSLVSRWNSTHCGGGLLWQIFADNPNGLDYKNSVSNGGLFQLSARLARATGNTTYLEWANKVWDWSEAVGFIGSDFTIYDGADSKDNCTKTNYLAFTYTTGIFLHGAAVLANHTGEQIWADRATNILNGANMNFFSPFANATDILYEYACEPVYRCNVDMKSFKGYLARFMWQSTQLLPSLFETVKGLLSASAVAAGKACTGGKDGTTCGQTWYVGGFDGEVGLGQQMCALETIQGLLIGATAPPLRGLDIKVVRDIPWNKAIPPTEPSPEPAPTKRSNSGSVAGVDWRWAGLGLGTAVLVWGMA